MYSGWGCKGPSPMLLFKVGSTTVGCPGLSDVMFLQGWRLHNLSGQPVSVFDHSCSKKVLSYV